MDHIMLKDALFCVLLATHAPFDDVPCLRLQQWPGSAAMII